MINRIRSAIGWTLLFIVDLYTLTVGVVAGVAQFLFDGLLWVLNWPITLGTAISLDILPKETRRIYGGIIFSGSFNGGVDLITIRLLWERFLHLFGYKR